MPSHLKWFSRSWQAHAGSFDAKYVIDLSAAPKGRRGGKGARFPAGELHCGSWSQAGRRRGWCASHRTSPGKASKYHLLTMICQDVRTPYTTTSPFPRATPSPPPLIGLDPLQSIPIPLWECLAALKDASRTRGRLASSLNILPAHLSMWEGFLGIPCEVQQRSLCYPHQLCL